MAGVAWTEAEKKYVVEGVARGLSYQAIANKLPGRSRQTVGRLVWRLGLSDDTRYDRKEITKRHKAIVLRMWGTCSLGRISSRIGVRVEDVRRYADEMGLVDKWVPKFRTAKPQPKPEKKQSKFSKADIAWAVDNFHTDPQARMIAAMVAGPAVVKSL